MYIEYVKNRTSPPAVLIRETFREDGKVKKRTLSNISKLPPKTILAIKEILNGSQQAKDLISEQTFELGLSKSHGHIEAILYVIQKLGIDKLISNSHTRQRDIIVALIASRSLNCKSKLSAINECNNLTDGTTLGLELGLGDLKEKECYEAMDWLLPKIKKIENKLAARFLEDETPFLLFDTSSSFYFGSTCELAQFGYSRDKKKGFKQINYGALTCKAGIPVSMMVFEGNTSDNEAFKAMRKMSKIQFKKEDIVFVSDRGMISSKIIKTMDPKEGENWISALKNKSIIGLIDDGAINMAAFKDQDLFEITHEDYPGERLIVCKNNELASKRVNTREVLLTKTEDILKKLNQLFSEKKNIAPDTEVAFRVGKEINKKKMSKHFILKYGNGNFEWERNSVSIDKEAKADGIYIIRTSLKKELLPSGETLDTYKGLSKVERLFRSFKASEINIRPFNHRLKERIEVHCFICMLAYIVEFHLRKAWGPLIFKDFCPVKENGGIKTTRSKAAKQKDQTKLNEEGERVQSYSDLLKTLAGVSKVQFKIKGVEEFEGWKISAKTELQQKAYDLLKKMYP